MDYTGGNFDDLGYKNGSLEKVCWNYAVSSQVYCQPKGALNYSL